MSRRFTMMPTSHAATTGPPRRGWMATTTPAMVSMTPTAYMSWCGVKGSGSDNTGARYWSQLTIRWKNLSRPNRIGATVKAVLRIMNACSAGSASRMRAAGPCSSVDAPEGVRGSRARTEPDALLAEQPTSITVPAVSAGFVVERTGADEGTGDAPLVQAMGNAGDQWVSAGETGDLADGCHVRGRRLDM